MFEFFYPLLHPHIHYLPIAGDASDVATVLEWAAAHDEYMKAIGIAGRMWAEKHLSDPSAVSYVSKLLHRYSNLQRFQTSLTAEMINWRVDVNEKVRNWISYQTGKSCLNISMIT